MAGLLFGSLRFGLNCAILAGQYQRRTSWRLQQRGARLLLRWNNWALQHWGMSTISSTVEWPRLEQYEWHWRRAYRPQRWPGDDVARGQMEDE